MRFLLICCLFIAVFSSRAQTAKSLIDKGDRFFSKGDYHSALQNYEKAEELTPGDAKIKYRLGHVFLSLGQDSKALQYFEETYRQEPNVDADIDYFLGIALQLDFQFQRAISFFDSYKAKNGRSTLLAEHKIRECKLGDSLMRNPVLCNIKVFEWPLNSLYQDYGPALPADGSKLVFTSARDTTKLSKKNKTIFEDVLICKRDGQSWTSPEKISSQINDTFHDAATYLTPDGKTIFLYYERGNGDIYQSTFDGSEWSQPKSMGPEINTLSWETSGCLSPDGNRFYFTSDRAGGEGGLDIYYTEKLANGNWGKAVNLGPSVNTPGNEDAPFVHQDGTLYFGSDGHQGLGDYDIYKSVLIEKKWSKPVNLGFPINTPKLDNYFYLAPDKKHGYFSSARKDGVGKLDICSVTFLDPPPKKEVVVQAPPPTPIEKPKPEPVQQTAQSDEFSDAIVSLKKDLGFASKLIGRVIDAETAKPLKAQVVLIENTTNSVKSRVYTNDSTGEFIITIPHGGNYGINTSVEGYLFNSLNFEVPLYSDYQEIETAILMQKVTVGSKAVMKNIFFDIGKSDLKKESVGELERILELMEKNPGIKLQVNGHTDNSGDPGTNKVLSLKRAETVMDFLVNRGIKAERLKAVGFGQERPIVSNDDESGGREINRRTEIEILETDAGIEK